MDEKAKTFLIGRLRNALDNAALKGIYITFGEDDHLESFTQGVVKEFGQWVTETDVLSEVYAHLLASIPAILSHKGDSRLDEVVDQETLRRVAAEIVQKFERLPLEYFIYFPLPRVLLSRECPLSANVTLVWPTEGQNALRGLRLGGASFGHHTYLRVRVSGYVSGGADQSAARVAISVAKQVLYAAVVKGQMISAPRLNLGVQFATHTETFPVAVREEISSQDRAAVQLDTSFARYLSSLTATGATESLLTTASSPEERLCQAMAQVVPILTKESADVGFIKSALEWGFDAASDLDEVSGFIKACISLEAALGEDTKPTEVTDRLADRCAFVLSDVPSGRRAIRNAIKEIYGLRSALVHGRKRRLNAQDQQLLRRGLFNTHQVLRAELRALERHFRRTEVQPNEPSAG